MLKMVKNFILETKFKISEIHLQQQIHETSNEILKMNIESYIQDYIRLNKSVMLATRCR